MADNLKPCLYVASRASIPARSKMWRNMRAASWPIVSSWIDQAGVQETSCMTKLWADIQAEISVSSLLILYAEDGDFPLKGGCVEAGMALAMGKPVLVVTTCKASDIGSWTKHPQVRIQTEMPSLAEAHAIMDRYQNTRAADPRGDDVDVAYRFGLESAAYQNKQRDELLAEAVAAVQAHDDAVRARKLDIPGWGKLLDMAVNEGQAFLGRAKQLKAKG